jgi:hypothetical protein
MFENMRIWCLVLGFGKELNLVTEIFIFCSTRIKGEGEMAVGKAKKHPPRQTHHLFYCLLSDEFAFGYFVALPSFGGDLRRGCLIVVW